MYAVTILRACAVDVRRATRNATCSLVVSLLFEPASRVAAQVETSDFIVDENGQHEWNGR